MGQEESGDPPSTVSIEAHQSQMGCLEWDSRGALSKVMCGNE